MKLEYCDECGAEELTLERRDDLRKSFEGGHKQGAEEFGALWLRANERARLSADRLDIDPSDHRIRALLTVATYNLLKVAREWYKQGGK